MKKIVNDPLLTAGRGLLIFLMGILGFAVVMLAIAFPAFLIFQDDFVAELARQGTANAEELIPALAFIIASLAALLALAIYFLMLLYRIVNSVGEGDPFVPINAERLARMGWIALIGQIALIPVGLAALWIGEKAGDLTENARLIADIDPSGILLALTLFILARVFRHGAAMREDLEGTV